MKEKYDPELWRLINKGFLAEANIQKVEISELQICKANLSPFLAHYIKKRKERKE